MILTATSAHITARKIQENQIAKNPTIGLFLDVVLGKLKVSGTLGLPLEGGLIGA